MKKRFYKKIKNHFKKSESKLGFDIRKNNIKNHSKKIIGKFNRGNI